MVGSLLGEGSQKRIAELCELFEASPPSRVRPGSVDCPVLSLKRARIATGLSFPMPEAEALAALELADRDAETPRLGVVADGRGGLRAGWLLVSVHSNVAGSGAAAALAGEAAWFEGVAARFNSGVPDGSGEDVYQTSEGWAWMEALEEAVGGTAATLLMGAMLTAATLLLVTGSLELAVATVFGVAAVLLAFVGYLSLRGYSIGLIEAIAVAIFIGE